MLCISSTGVLVVQGQSHAVLVILSVDLLHSAYIFNSLWCLVYCVYWWCWCSHIAQRRYLQFFVIHTLHTAQQPLCHKLWCSWNPLHCWCRSFHMKLLKKFQALILYSWSSTALPCKCWIEQPWTIAPVCLHCWEYNLLHWTALHTVACSVGASVDVWNYSTILTYWLNLLHWTAVPCFAVLGLVCLDSVLACFFLHCASVGASVDILGGLPAIHPIDCAATSSLEMHTIASEYSALQCHWGHCKLQVATPLHSFDWLLAIQSQN